MSNLKLKADVTDYESAAAFLGNAEEKKLGHNTYIYRLRDDQIGVKYHQTRIVTYWKVDNEITITHMAHGGYTTATTKHRLNLLTPDCVRIFQKNFTWYIQDGDKSWVFNRCPQIVRGLNGLPIKPIRSTVGRK